MSTSYNKFEFSDDLSSSFSFQNTMQPEISETNEMFVKILNYNGDGYILSTKTPYNSDPEFEFNILLNSVSTTLYNYSADKLSFYKEIAVLTPINSYNPATKAYVDSAIGGVVSPTSVTLTGDITGSGVTGTPFSTTLNKTLNQISNAGNLDIANYKILNVVDPTTSQGAATKNYIDNKTWSTSQITDYTTNTNSLISSAIISPTKLTGYPGTSSTYLKGDGSWANFSTEATTSSLTLRLDQFAVPTNTLNLNSQRIQNLQDPLSGNPQDAATKHYVDQVAAGISGGLPVGAMTMWCAEILPIGGWLECDGSAISRITYATLFAVLGTRWGQGDGSTTFNLPDTRGLFPRGWNHGTTKAAPYNDPDAASRIAAATGGLTGDNIGTLQADDYQAHSHTYNQPGTSTSVGGIGSTNVAQPRSSTSTGTSPTSGGNETRPVNFSIMFIIKAI